MADAVRFAEAIDFLRRRLAMPDGAWRELIREIDAAATDRARGMGEALTRDIIAAVLQALEEGDGFDSFLDAWDATLARHGWPAGEEFENARRAALTFRVMTAQAYAAGRWRQIQRLKAIRPWLRYVHVDPLLTQPGSRHEHAAWHGVILHADHPWWATHYPPNGFNCRCYVQSLSDRDLARFGWEVSAEPPEARTVIRMARVNGVLTPVETPAGIDPGFAYNVGMVGLRIAA